MKKLIMLFVLANMTQAFASTQKFECANEEILVSFDVSSFGFRTPQNLKIQIKELKKETSLTSTYLAISSKGVEGQPETTITAKGNTHKKNLIGTIKVDGSFDVKVIHIPQAQTTSAAIKLTQPSKRIDLDLVDIPCSVKSL